MDPSYLLSVFAGRIPLFLLLLGGIVFAMTRWNRHPKVSFLTILGLLFYLLETTFFTFTIYLLPTLLPAGGPMAMNETFYNILYVADDIAYAAVLIVLVSAVFTRRTPNEVHSA
jgi:hypothetical protein